MCIAKHHANIVAKPNVRTNAIHNAPKLAQQHAKIYVAVIVKELVGIQGNAITAPIVAKTIVLAAAKIHVNLYRKEKIL
ncbi:hypothetical protein [Xylanibacter rarus]|uniref:hypothetical protein n=1 Tax=Xylanibacter rarus TaxID=1676614 RepID=UPI003FD6C17B